MNKFPMNRKESALKWFKSRGIDAACNERGLYLFVQGNQGMEALYLSNAEIDYRAMLAEGEL